MSVFTKENPLNAELHKHELRGTIYFKENQSMATLGHVMQPVFDHLQIPMEHLIGVEARFDTGGLLSSGKGVMIFNPLFNKEMTHEELGNAKDPNFVIGFEYLSAGTVDPFFFNKAEEMMERAGELSKASSFKYINHDLPVERKAVEFWVGNPVEVLSAKKLQVLANARVMLMEAGFSGSVPILCDPDAPEPTLTIEWK
jgi:hypothetical protein